MIDPDDIDYALHEIRQMTLVAMASTEGMFQSEVNHAVFELPGKDADMLTFSISDVLKRVETLRAAMFEPQAACPKPRQVRAKIIPIGGGRCA
jgi:hypothetical protein